MAFQITNNPHFLEEEAFLAALPAYGVQVSEDILAAVIQAEVSHGSQFRESNGEPYKNQHLFPVALDVVRFYSEVLEKAIDPAVVKAAILHDVPEDDPEMPLWLFYTTFGSDVADIVAPLTKGNWRERGGNTELEQRANLERYLVSVQMLNAPRSSRVIKGFDRAHNLVDLPVEDTDKTLRYFFNTRDIFAPWLKEAEPLVYPIVTEELRLLETRLENCCYEKLLERTG